MTKPLFEERPDQPRVVTNEITSSLNSSQQALDSDHSDSQESDHEQHAVSFVSQARRIASKTVVSFEHDDPEHPRNWSTPLKMFVLVTGATEVMNSTIGSSLSGGASHAISRAFHVTNQEQLVLPITTFLIGYVFGPLVWGPSSEAYGRRYPLLVAFTIYTIFMMACAVAQTYTSLLIFRLFDGVAASAPIAVVGGVYADICSDPTTRGRLMAYYMTATTVGPILGPLISGFLSEYSWRWCFWFGLIFAGTTLPMAILMPETYAPVILQRRAKKLRKETGNQNILSPLELGNRGLRETLAVNMARPFQMILYESIVSFSCLYLALLYSVLYIYFQLFPIVFQGMYHMSSAQTGLCLIPIGVGTILACPVFHWYDHFLAKAKARNAKWAHIEEYRRLPLACIGGPLYVISLFWISWTTFPSIHWAVPMMSGGLFGLGYMLTFLGVLNYLTDAYETFSASALSATSCTRSVLGALLPLATKPMIDRMGVNWACTLLSFFSLGVSIIPFVFIRYGDHIRANSKFCQELKRLKGNEAGEEQVHHAPSAVAPVHTSHTAKDLEKQVATGHLP